MLVAWYLAESWSLFSFNAQKVTYKTKNIKPLNLFEGTTQKSEISTEFFTFTTILVRMLHGLTKGVMTIHRSSLFCFFNFDSVFISFFFFLYSWFFSFTSWWMVSARVARWYWVLKDSCEVQTWGAEHQWDNRSSYYCIFNGNSKKFCQKW